MITIKNNYTFCKKDGTLKQNHIRVCEYLVKSKIERHDVSIGRSDEIIKTYNCYTTPRVKLCAKDKRSYISKIKEICSNFDITDKEWYSYMSLTVELYGKVEEMIKELNDLLRRG